MAIALRTLSSVGVMASSYALVCSELQIIINAYNACSVVRISLKSISCACKLRRSFEYDISVFVCVRRHRIFNFIALAQMRRHTADHRIFRIDTIAEEER